MFSAWYQGHRSYSACFSKVKLRTTEDDSVPKIEL